VSQPGGVPLGIARASSQTFRAWCRIRLHGHGPTKAAAAVRFTMAELAVGTRALFVGEDPVASALALAREFLVLCNPPVLFASSHHPSDPRRWPPVPHVFASESWWRGGLNVSATSIPPETRCAPTLLGLWL
jgi:hypothetical protein